MCARQQFSCFLFRRHLKTGLKADADGVLLVYGMKCTPIGRNDGACHRKPDAVSAAFLGARRIPAVKTVE